MKSEETLFTAAIESADIFNNAVREVAQTSGLMTALTHFRAVDDIVRTMGFRPERADQVLHLLKVLVATGAVEQRQHGGVPVFRAKRQQTASAPERYAPKYDKLDFWYGEGHAELIRNGNKAMLGDDLSFLRTPDAAIKFNGEYETAWRTNLQNPLYDFGRMLAVREMTARGNRFLDLACGPGFGAVRLAEFSESACTVLGVDKSTDFLEIARTNLYPGAQVSFIERDLNTGLPPLMPGSFDGVLFNGAFHFIEDKPARLREIWRALRPGGVFALGHCFSYSGFADQAMHDFYFSLLKDKAYILPWSTLKDLVSEAGFTIYKEFHRGSHSHLIAERPLNEVADTAETTLADIAGKFKVHGGVAQ
ncbi:class I SAM-dependent methyltransferase [Actinomadura terrae]|uniref:class I SAM-dependent methyltransferase n=1 Tax=Actinomadura terrae TaxID=604353 RepID=UPI001FA7EF29|nr:class I SAM-dependent methyltransferase [Actinomadura terrae]